MTVIPKAPDPILPPVARFNDIVGPLLKNCRIPTDPHRDGSLQRSLSWFIDMAYQTAKRHLEEYEVPYEQRREREAESVLYIDNLRYLRRRFNDFRRKIGCPSILGEDAKKISQKLAETGGTPVYCSHEQDSLSDTWCAVPQGDLS